MAGVYAESGDRDAAETLYQEILQSSSHDDDHQYASRLNNLAEAYRKAGQFDRAEPLFERSLSILRHIQPEAIEELLRTLNNLALLHVGKGDFLGAKPLYEEALVVHNSLTTGVGPEKATILSNIASYYRGIGSLAKAEENARFAVTEFHLTVGNRNVDYVTAISNLVMILYSRGNCVEALRYMLQVVRIEDEILDDVFSVSTELQRLEFIARFRQNMSLFLTLILKEKKTNPEIVAQAINFVLRRKGIVCDSLVASRLSTATTESSDVLSKLNAVRSEIAACILHPRVNAGETSDQHHDRLREKRRELESQIFSKSNRRRLAELLQTADAESVAHQLDRDTALIEIIQFRPFSAGAIPYQGENEWKAPRYVAFVIRKDREIAVVDLGDASKIDEHVKNFREWASNDENLDGRDLIKREQRPPKSSSDAGEKLRAIILDSLIPHLGETKHLLVSPDGNLCLLPFGALPFLDEQLLIDHFNITYLTTARDVLRFKPSTNTAPNSVVVVCDPDFDCRVSEDVDPPVTTRTPNRSWFRSEHDTNRPFSRLAGTRLEGACVASKWANSAVLALSGQNATKAEIARLRSPGVLHFATHGFFVSESESMQIAAADSPSALTAFGRATNAAMLRSGLALAGANAWLLSETHDPHVDTGLLTAEEVSGLDLTGTELVVLSACDTGVGDIQAGEGVFGLRRAFVLAGAKTVVMSLWKIPDSATALLIDRFYDNLVARAATGSEALREAQTYLRQLTVKDIRCKWQRQLPSDPDTRRILELPDAERPFAHPRYWSAFICQGVPSRLSMMEADLRTREV